MHIFFSKNYDLKNPKAMDLSIILSIIFIISNYIIVNDLLPKQ